MTAATTLLVALLALLTHTSLAAAHARVESTAPVNGAVVKTEPATVSFTFDENVESSFGAVRVFDDHAKRVDIGQTFHPGETGPQVAVKLRPGLPQGTYTATYRVISADGHPVSGGFIFSIGKVGQASAQSVTQLAGKAGGGPVTSSAFAIVRALQYGAISVAIGLLAFLVLVLPRGRAREAVDDRARRILFWAGVAGAVSGVLAVLLEGAVGGSTSLWAALKWSIVKETLSTRFGVVWWVAAIGWVVVAMLGPRVKRIRLEFIAAPGLLLALLPAFGGHAATQHPELQYVIANVVHVASISVWFGGLIALLVLLPVAARAEGDGAAPGSGDAAPGVLATALPRFSRIALLSVALILLTGTLQAIWELTSLDDLVDTAFGRAVLIKVLLLAAAGLFAARNHLRTVPALAGPRSATAATVPPLAGADPTLDAVDGPQTPATDAAVDVATDTAVDANPRRGADLRTLLVAVRAEVILVIGIFAAAGALGGYPPPTQIPPGPFQATVPIGPNNLTLSVDPAQVGSNQIRIALKHGGSPETDTKQLTVSAVEADRGIGPLEIEVTPAGPGTWVASSALLPAGGHWRIQVVDRISDFDQYQSFVTVPVP